MWEPQMAALAPYFSILRYDNRGHGQSTAPAGPDAIADLGLDLLHLLDALGIERASFCGLSMGGVLGQWLGVHAPGRFDKLVLANTAAKIGTPEVWNARIELVLRDGLDPVIPGTLERWFTPAFHAAHPDVIRSIASTLAATGVPAYAACCAAIRDADFREQLSVIALPTLVIAGTYDPVTTPQDGRYLADNIPLASYVELPAAHLSSTETAPGFNTALLRFLEA
jgi:3-oxoadipate enol-lactonase/4-carboxymuconolactone decarboxylase